MYIIKCSYEDSDAVQEVDSADSLVEAERLLNRYRGAYGCGYCLWIERKA